jgi:dTDP-4-amino-4,6-dideoxygalactose transaminase
MPGRQRRGRYSQVIGWSACEDSAARSLIDDSNHYGTHAHHKFVIEASNRDIVLQRNLDLARQIETRIHYREPLHELPAYAAVARTGHAECGQQALARRVLSLPLYPELTDLEVDYIIDSGD